MPSQALLLCKAEKASILHKCHVFLVEYLSIFLAILPVLIFPLEIKLKVLPMWPVLKFVGYILVAEVLVNLPEYYTIFLACSFRPKIFWFFPCLSSRYFINVYKIFNLIKKLLKISRCLFYI